ncbi:MAG: hypothetical protein GY842_15140, partial [bacterium]|nr:hypothetical protein [bacterium]
MLIMLSLLVVAGSLAAQEDTDKNGVSPTVISLPSGPGSVEGLGEAFKPQLNDGSAVYQVKIRVPKGAGGLAPQLVLRYNSGSGDGPVGLGWTFAPGGIRRKTDRGIPRYVDATDDIDNDHDGWIDEDDETDRFVAPDGTDLVPDGDGYYRARVEGSFIRYRRSGDGWEAQLKNGGRIHFGLTPAARVADGTGARTYRWLPEKETDANGNTIEYVYTSLSGSDNQVYLSGIRWGAGAGPWSHYYMVVCGYEAKPDWKKDYRSGFLVKTGHRLKTVSVGVHGAAPPLSQPGDLDGDGQTDALVRRYELTYGTDGLEAPHLKKITLFGSDGVNTLPPVRFDYHRLDLPSRLSADGGVIASQNAPPAVMDNPGAELIDFNRDGLPDILRTTGIAH